MNFASTIRVHVSHEDPLVEAGLVAILARDAGLQILQDSDASQADLYVTDHAHGIELAQSLHEQRVRAEHQPRVLIISRHDREWDLRYALSAGVHGYLMQGCEVSELVEAVQVLSSGRRYMSRQLGNVLAEGLMSSSLTARETDVLQLLAAGMCNKQISSQLDLALGTVKSHVRAVFSKLGVNSRTRAIFVATQRGLVAAPDAHAPRAGEGRTAPPELIWASAIRGGLMPRHV